MLQVYEKYRAYCDVRYEKRYKARFFSKVPLCTLLAIFIFFIFALCVAFMFTAPVFANNSNLKNSENAERVSGQSNLAQNPISQEQLLAKAAQNNAVQNCERMQNLQNISANVAQNFLCDEKLNSTVFQNVSNNTVQNFISSEQLLDNAVQGTSLNELYKAWVADDSHGSDLIISEGGTYYLEADLISSCRIVIKAPEQNVTLQLYGHTLTIDTQTIGYGIDIQQAAQVTIDGSATTGSSAAQSSSIVFSGYPMLSVINSSADKLVVKELDIQAKSRQTRLSNLESSCITVNAGTLEATQVKAAVDQSNQSIISDTSGASFYGAPAAFNIKEQCAGASFENCIATTTGSPAVAIGSSPDTEIGHAYALRSETNSTITVNGGSYSAQIAHGVASAIRAKNSVITGSNVSLAANAAKRAIALEAFSENGMQVDTQLNLDFSGQTTPELSAGFYSSAENAFTFTANADFPSIGVVVGKDASSENLPNVRIASVSGAAASKIAAKLFNALDSQATCNIATDEQGIYFAFDEEKAAVEVRSSAGQTKRYAAISEGIEAMQDGDTLVLLKDTGDITFNKDAATSSVFTIDMNAKTATLLTDSSIAKLCIVSTGGRGHIVAAPKTSAAVSVSAAGSFSMSEVDVINSQANASACGIEVTKAANIEFNNVSVDVSAQISYSRGVRLSSSGASLLIKNSQVKASTACAGVSVRGLMCSAKTTCDVYATDISVDGVTSTITGIESNGVVRFCGTDSNNAASIKVNAAETPTSAACIGLLNSSAKAIVKDADISLSCSATDAQSFCTAFMSGSKTSYVDATWVFDGLLNVNAAGTAQLTHKTTPLCLGADLNLPQALSVLSTQLDNMVFAKAASEKDLSLDDTGSDAPTNSISPSLAALFNATGDYLGCVASAQEIESVLCLVWQHDAVAQVTHGTTSTEYSTISQALAASEDGDTVQLLADIDVSECLTIGKQITLDLNGRKLKLTLSSKTGQTEAFSYTCAGVFTIKDSTAKTGEDASLGNAGSDNAGSLEINIGSPLESSQANYSAINVTGGGTLVLDGITANVSYSGSTLMTNLPTPILRGVALSNGSLQMINASSLFVNAAKTSGEYGANTAIGVYASSNDASSHINIEDGCSIEVNNTAKIVSLDSLQVPDPSESDSIAQPAYVTQIFPDKTSNFYREICEKFVEQAQFDDTVESGTYNSEIYYTAPLMLDDGTCIWAYSDPVDATSKGHLESIVPTRFFVKCGKDTPTYAYGIQSGSSFAGTVTIDGKVSANCAFGNAYAIDAQGSSTWTAKATSLTESHSSSTYFKEGVRLDMRDYFDLGSKYDSAVLIPENGAPQVSLVVSFVGASVRMDSTAQVSVDGVQQQQSTEEEVDVKENGIQKVDDTKRSQLWGTKEISVTFDNVRAADGSASQVISNKNALFCSTLSQAGVSVAQPADYKDSNGTTFRFIGWSVLASSSGNIYSPDTFADKVLLNSSISGVKNGSVVFTARYVPVASGQYLVSFKTDTTVLAYSITNGKTPVYADVSLDTRAAVPSKIDSADGCYYSFAGWSDTSGNILWTLPSVGQDCEYTATFETQESLVSLTFTYRNTSGTLVSSSDKVKYYADTNEVASNYVKIGDVVKTAETVYTCTGFGPRKTDIEPYYTDKLPSMKTDSFWRYSNVYYAKYDTAARTVNVTFIDGDTEYAKTSSPVQTSVLFDTVLSSLGKSNPEKDASGRSFLGWSKTKGASTPDISVVNSARLSDIVDSESDDLVLYAVYGTAQPATIEFYDAEAYPNNFSDDLFITKLSVERGSSIEKTLKAAKKSAITPTRAGMYFAGWIDAAGNTFSTSDEVKANTKLFATYKKVNVVKSGQADTDFSIDVSKLFIAVSGIEQAEKVTLSLSPVTTADTTLSQLLVGEHSYSPMLGSANIKSIYSLRLFYTKENREYEIENNFGSIAVTANIPSASQSSKTRAFWVGSDGMAYTKVSQNNEKLSFDVHYLGYVEDGYGNLVIGIVANSATQEALDANTISESTDSEENDAEQSDDATDEQEKLDTSVLQAAPAVSFGSTAPSLAAANSGQLAGALENGAINSAQSAGEISGGLTNNNNNQAKQSSDIQSQVSEGQNGNVVGLIIIALLFAALFARFAYYLFKRRKKNDTDEEGEQMPLKEVVHF